MYHASVRILLSACRFLLTARPRREVLLEFRRKVAFFEEFSLRARYARVISAALRQEEASSAVRAPRSLGSRGPWRLILAPRGPT